MDLSGQFILNAGVILAALLILLAFWRRRWYDLSGHPRNVLMMTPGQWFILTMAGYFVPPLLFVFAVPMLRERLGGDEKSIEFLGTATPILHVASISLMATLLIVSRATTLAFERSKARRGLIDGALAGILAVSPILAVGILCVMVVTLVRGSPPEVVAHEILRLLRDHRGDSWGWILMACAAIGAPIAEELVWRGGLQSALLRASQELGRPRPWFAILATSVLFATIHISVVPPHALPTLFALSVVLGLVRERTGSLLAPIIVHAMFNGANLVAALA